MFDVQETESKCYRYFTENGIKNRADLRTHLKTNPIPNVSQSFVEGLFANFQRERKEFKLRKKGKVQRTVCISDLHIPYHDSKALNLAFRCIIDLQPEYLVLNGDIIDCYWHSKFLKKPKNTNFLQEEIDIFYKTFSYLRRHIPNTEIHYVLGNHEDRLEKDKKENPQFFGLKSLEPKKLLKLDKLGIIPHKTKVSINGMLYYHGEVASKNSSYSAKAESDRRKNINGISGHTHRMGSYYKTYDGDTTYWMENGCLCKNTPEYIRDVVDWQHGFTIITYFNGINQVDPVLINDYKFIYNGVIYD